MKLAGAVLAVFLVLGVRASGAADTDAVSKALTPLRQSTKEPMTSMPREFLTARDALRDWIETQLRRFPVDGDTSAFARDLNAEIVARDLACAEASGLGVDRCASPGEVDARGYLGAIEVSRVLDLLIVQAEIGIPCGFDETAYVYEWVKNGWRRLLDTSQSAIGNAYIAEQIQQIAFVQPENGPRDALLFAVTGLTPRCADQYRPAHYRVWSAKRGAAASLIVDGREGDAYASRRDPAVSARFEGADLLLEMDVRSMDPSRRSRTAVRRFNFEKSEPRRVAPLALTPRDFVEEWLRASWSDASRWTLAAARESLAPLHEGAKANRAPARFSGPTQRCEMDSAVQVGVRFADGERFFRIKNDSNGAYLMLGADSMSAPSCAKPDSSLDTPRTLF